MPQKYKVNKDHYIVEGKGFEPIFFPISKHGELLIDYCTKQLDLEAICLKYGISRQNLERYKRAMGFSRNSIPVSDEEATELSEADLATLIVERKAKALERAQDLYLEKVKGDALKWQDFQKGVLKPFEAALKNFKPKPYKTGERKIEKNGRFFVTCLSDLQMGLSADSRDLFRQESWSTERAKKALINLINQIQADIKNDKTGFEGCVLVLAGDLLHGPKGSTEKGTPLEVDTYRATQIDSLLEILYLYVETLAKLFPKVEIHSVGGNHSFTYDYPVLLAVKNYFKNYNHVNFNIYSSRTAVFKISKTMIVLDHGASDKFNSSVPSSGKQRESYIQSLILAKKTDFPECKQCLFIQGDRHHWEWHEYNDFEFIMLGALPLGDIYSDNLNLNSRSRQNCFIFDDSGVKSSLHYYIDQCF